MSKRASKVAKDLAKVERKVINKINHKQHESKKKLSSHAGGIDDSELEAIRAAMSVLHPERITGTRVPDLVSMATTTFQTVDSFSLTSLADGAGGFQAGLRLYACPLGQLAYPLTYAAGAVATASSRNVPGMTTIASAQALLRVASMSLVVENSTSALNMQGQWVIGNLKNTSAWNQLGTGLVGSSQGALTPLKNISRGVFTPEQNTCRMVWVRSDETDSSMIAPTSGVADDATVINFSVLSSAAQSLLVIVTVNWEAVPNQSNQQLFETKAVMVDPSAYNRALNKVVNEPTLPMNRINQAQDAISPAEIGKTASKLFGLAGNVVTGNWGSVAKTLYKEGPSLMKSVNQSLMSCASAIGGWFDADDETDVYLKHMAFWSSDNVAKETIRKDLVRLASQNKVPKEFLAIFDTLASVKVKVNHDPRHRRFKNLTWETMENKTDDEGFQVVDGSPAQKDVVVGKALAAGQAIGYAVPATTSTALYVMSQRK